MDKLLERYRNSLLPYWKHELGLDAWDIKLQSRRHAEMDGDNSMGEVWFRKTHQQAIVYLLDEVDYNAVELENFDIDPEETLVHELLHLVFMIEEHGNHEYEVMETGINRLAKVLVKYRKQTALRLQDE